jgi:hypothetical protein
MHSMPKRTMEQKTSARTWHARDHAVYTSREVFTVWSQLHYLVPDWWLIDPRVRSGLVCV